MGATKDTKPGFDSEFIGCFLKIKLRGEIDHHCAVSIRNAIDTIIYDKRPRGLIIDMSLVDFMDSSGLGLIMGRYSVMNDLGGQVIIKDPNQGIEKIMKLAGIERLIKIEKTAETIYTAKDADLCKRAQRISTQKNGRRKKNSIIKREEAK